MNDYLAFYQVYSFIPNSISTLAMAFWIADGIIKGENSLYFSPSPDDFTISLSVSQDTIVAVGTNIAGWTAPPLREPNVATGVDIAVLAYDVAGLGIPGTDIRLSTFINPTFTYDTQTGFDFSWQQD